MRLLLVEDHAELAEWVARSLRHAGFVLDVLNRGDHADQALRTERYDLVILDLSLPGLDGLEVLRRLRHRESGPDKPAPTPVMVLTARGSTDERVLGLNLGADDYLPKPFEPKELLLRLNSILRRRPKPLSQMELKLGRWLYRPSRDELTDGDETIRLSSVEAGLLKALAERPGTIVSRDELVARQPLASNARTVDVQVTRLRRKIEDDPKQPRTLITVRGEGYMLRPDP